MRIRKNPVLGTWEMAESERQPWQSVHRRAGLVKRTSNKLLIADDEKTVRAVFRRTLLKECPDFEVTEVENGRDAFEEFRTDHHGMIIMDLLMPVMDGQQAFESILKFCKDENWEVPSVIFCTGYDPSQLIRKTVAEDGIHCMLQKPVSPRTLIEAVKARI